MCCTAISGLIPCSSKYSKPYSGVDIFKVAFGNFSLIEDQKSDLLPQLIAFAVRNKIDKSIDDATVTKIVIDDFNESWKNFDYRISKIAGKEFFTNMNRWLNGKYHVSIPASTAFFYLQADEIAPEINDTLREFIKTVN